MSKWLRLGAESPCAYPQGAHGGRSRPTTGAFHVKALDGLHFMLVEVLIKKRTKRRKRKEEIVYNLADQSFSRRELLSYSVHVLLQ